MRLITVVVALLLALAIVTASYIDREEECDGNDVNSGKIDSGKLLYLDDDIIVVEKQTNVQSAPGFREKESLATILSDIFHLPRVDHMIVHRLDYGTSGVIVYARNELSLKSLHEQFRNKNKFIYKKYTAIVTGLMKSYEGEICLPIGRDEVKGPPLQCINVEHGKESTSLYRVVEQSAEKNTTLVHLTPITGRTHQLRVHMQAIGHPIVGDLFYAPKEIYKASPRLLLHAEELRFIHPRTLIPHKFISKCPFHL